jgi:hypothetical protein
VPVVVAEALALVAVPVLASGDELEALLAALSIRRSNITFPLEVFLGTTARPIGKIHSMWGTTLKCTCKVHPNCSVMVLKSWFGGLAEHRLYTWVASAVTSTENEHWQAAQRLTTEGKRHP